MLYNPRGLTWEEIQERKRLRKLADQKKKAHASFEKARKKRKKKKK